MWDFLLVEIDNCKNNTCKNGASCLDGTESYTCVCTDGWDGKFCEQGILFLLLLNIILGRQGWKSLFVNRLMHNYSAWKTKSIPLSCTQLISIPPILFVVSELPYFWSLNLFNSCSVHGFI